MFVTLLLNQYDEFLYFLDTFKRAGVKFKIPCTFVSANLSATDCATVAGTVNIATCISFDNLSSNSSK